MTFQEKLDLAVGKNNSLLCVGLDSDIEKLPAKFKSEKYPQFTFNKWIVDQTADLVCAFKPNTAFYEARGIRGIEELKLTCDYIRTTYTNVPIILDAKRGDIGNTNRGYVKFVFESLQADAITLQPYPGREALNEFLKISDKGCIIWCRTSNPGAGELQDLKVGNEAFYMVLAKKIINEWNKNGNCMLVIGATYPEELAEIRKIAGDMTFLVPGIGAQGGDLESIMKFGLNSQKKGLIINSSRGIIFLENPKMEAINLREQINKYRN